MTLSASSSDLLPVGVIGLGGIAQKAYLPVLAALPGLDLHLMTRGRAKLDRLGEAYRIGADRRFTDLSELLGSGIRAAFVHASTDQHATIVEQLLMADVDVFVDKPLSYHLEESRRLVELAEARGRSLMVGFNRRFAPAYVEARDLTRDLIVFQKNRKGVSEAPRTLILDDFIHVADTVAWLAPGEVTHTDVRVRVRDGRAEHVVLTLGGDGFTALGIMNWANGSTEEVLQVSGGNTKRQITDLADVVVHQGFAQAEERRSGWASVGHLRGFDAMCARFLDAVRSGEVLSARDALRTHELCEEVAQAAEKAAS